MTGRVVVVGSANIDLVVDVPRSPGPGETVLGGTLRRTAGGKGANQAVAAARAGGADTWFLGALGRDGAADLLLCSLIDAGVRTDLLGRSEEPTGTALIWVTPDGGNSIIVAPGANSQVTLDDAAKDQLAGADVVLAQLEIPLETVLAAARARTAGAVFVLNAAPSRSLPDVLWEQVDVLVANEPEAVDMAAAGPGTDPVRLAAILLEKVAAVVVTLGPAGALVARRGHQPVTVPAPKVAPVDTTGAGDTFCGALAAALARGEDLPAAARVASAAAALAVTRPGAQGAVPSADEVAEMAGRLP
ncbi:ribokinase [Georgenia sp. TF02-10]|uniref:ribokinase n=1 Tax=Georgenia sp. TF02-10 TaxID=2917725 RepID=UPI001FA7015A|nr:ribokinase [Georgenia sp. TF02-10]UNX54827.1 ribokinase [Georgenia sp. TF02-10]